MEPTRRKVVAGMNTFFCPICREGNRALRRDEFHGTLFIPVTMEQLAHLRATDTEHKLTVHCHERGHGIVVLINAHTKRG